MAKDRYQMVTCCLLVGGRAPAYVWVDQVALYPLDRDELQMKKMRVYELIENCNSYGSQKPGYGNENVLRDRRRREAAGASCKFSGTLILEWRIAIQDRNDDLHGQSSLQVVILRKYDDEFHVAVVYPHRTAPTERLPQVMFLQGLDGSLDG